MNIVKRIWTVYSGTVGLREEKKIHTAFSLRRVFLAAETVETRLLVEKLARSTYHDTRCPNVLGF